MREASHTAASCKGLRKEKGRQSEIRAAPPLPPRLQLRLQTLLSVGEWRRRGRAAQLGSLSPLSSAARIQCTSASCGPCLSVCVCVVGGVWGREGIVVTCESSSSSVNFLFPLVIM